MSDMIKIRTMTGTDADAVLAIYQEGIETGHATFETRAPDWPHFDGGKLATPRLVSEDADGVTGWAVLSPTSSRCVYGGVAEVTIYIAGRAKGQGIGKALLGALVEASEAEGIWMLVAGIMRENEVSIALHEKCGFELLGYRKRLGKMLYGPMQGQWRDIAWMERRSDVVGID
ncbi:GNAT family N-acetyltransferase [Maricaulis sp.]|uniref:GNAT family N-acetyltransferase n=1 Tax=Maricaulis sp. TaxID=1486257 RepID=UPI002610A4C1|nr:GNAT family N-acetyltransferase [Maricaulis sp.]